MMFRIGLFDEHIKASICRGLMGLSDARHRLYHAKLTLQFLTSSLSCWGSQLENFVRASENRF